MTPQWLQGVDFVKKLIFDLLTLSDRELSHDSEYI